VKFAVLADYDMAILRGSVKGGLSPSFFVKLLLLVPIGSPRNCAGSSGAVHSVFLIDVYI
jgi:hypothetical protein